MLDDAFNLKGSSHRHATSQVSSPFTCKKHMSIGLVKPGYHLEKHTRAPLNANRSSVIVSTCSKSKIVASAGLAAREKSSQLVLVQDLSNRLTPYEEVLF